MPCILAGDKPCVKTGRRQGLVGQPLLAVPRSVSPADADSQEGVLANNLVCHHLSPNVVTGYALRVCLAGDYPKLRETVRKLAAIAALLAVLSPGVSALTETLSAADLPACCNTAYCPVHHRQVRNFQKDKSNCDAMGTSGQNDCSMRACDAAPNIVVGTATFVLVTPVALRGPAIAEATPALASQFFPYVATIPLTPPPRAFPS